MTVSFTRFSIEKVLLPGIHTMNESQEIQCICRNCVKFDKIKCHNNSELESRKACIISYEYNLDFDTNEDPGLRIK